MKRATCPKMQLYQQLLIFSEEKWVKIEKVFWLSSFGHTDKITPVRKLNQWPGGFFNFTIEMKWVFLAKSIDRRAGHGICPRLLHSWQLVTLQLVWHCVAFVVSMDPDVHFKCCISADSKVQASIEHETEVKPIQGCRVHSGALDELTSQRSTGKCSL